MDLWSAAWLWEWLRLKRGVAWLLSRRQAAFHGLVLRTFQMRTACQTAGNRQLPVEEQRVAAVHGGVGQRSLERLFPDLMVDSMTQATLSAGQDPQTESGIGFKRARNVAAPANLGALIAAKPRVQGMIRDALWAGLPPKHPWGLALPRSSKQPPPPISAPSMTKIKLYVQKAAQAADEAWQQTMGGLQGPGVANPTIASLENPCSRRTAMTRTSQRPGRAVSVGHSSKRSCHDSLIGLVSGG